MTYHPRLDRTCPIQSHNLIAVDLPEECGSGGQTDSLFGQVVSFAEEVSQSKPEIESRVSEVKHLVIQQNQFTPIEECVLRAEIAVD